MKTIPFSQFKCIIADKTSKQEVYVQLENKLKKVSAVRRVLSVHPTYLETEQEINKEQAIRDYSTQSYQRNGKWFVASKLMYQPAKHMIVTPNSLTLLAFNHKNQYGSTVMEPSPDFTENEMWLKIGFVEAV